jgi:hypothetical protein
VTNKLLRLLAPAAALACLGCAKGNGIYSVSGTVTYKGAPAAGAYVKFFRQGADPAREQTIMGVVQADGSFSLDCGSLGKGAPPGDYTVLIEWKYDPSLPPARSPTEAGARPDRLKGRYADAKWPLLHAEVRPQNNTLPPFELQE